MEPRGAERGSAPAQLPCALHADQPTPGKPPCFRAPQHMLVGHPWLGCGREASSLLNGHYHVPSSQFKCRLYDTSVRSLLPLRGHSGDTLGTIGSFCRRPRQSELNCGELPSQVTGTSAWGLDFDPPHTMSQQSPLQDSAARAHLLQ